MSDNKKAVLFDANGGTSGADMQVFTHNRYDIGFTVKESTQYLNKEEALQVAKAIKYSFKPKKSPRQHFEQYEGVDGGGTLVRISGCKYNEEKLDIRIGDINVTPNTARIDVTMAKNLVKAIKHWIKDQENKGK